MTMKERLQAHREVEQADRNHRDWFLNTQVLDRLTDTFPPGIMVENFGVRAIVDWYEVRGKTYTGNLVLRDIETGQRWVGKPEFCKAIA